MSTLPTLSTKQPIVKQRGFTLIELVIVLALIGISAVISLRFISEMAHSQVASAERANALAGARFAMERLRRELSQAYSPSVQVSSDGDCVSFVPVIAAGSYSGEVTQRTAQFIWPTALHNKKLASAIMAINSPSAIGEHSAAWRDYPELNNAQHENNNINVARLTGIEAEDSELPIVFTFSELFGQGEQQSSPFSFDSTKLRYSLLKTEQVRFCLQDTQLERQVKDGAHWLAPQLMLAGIQSSRLFSEYNSELQLLTFDLLMNTRDGELALSSQLQVNYAP